jgi:isopentenyl diphosphate isomerase/L-lactate dehydrogenase-like FMN-dependent dehydrogenase
MVPESGPLNVSDYERLAAERLEPGMLGYIDGGADDELTLRENVAAFARVRLRPRVLVDVSAATTAAKVLGEELSMPLLIAPTAFQRLVHPDGEQATARAAAKAGTVMCVSTLATATPAEVADAAPEGARWFQLYCYRDRGLTRALVEQAVEAGYRALVLTVDAPGTLGRRERDLRSRFELPAEVRVPSYAEAVGRPAGATPAEIIALMDATLTWRDLEELQGMSDLPLLVKGVLTEEDARLVCEHGAAGVIVSNHGGRQLDGVPATLEALPEVAEAVEGRAEVLLDGGVRRGTDVAKALALGARAVLVGRPVLWALAAGGERGVAHLLELLAEELRLALVLLGCPSPAHVTPAHANSGRFATRE